MFIGDVNELKHYIMEFEKKCINYTLDFRTKCKKQKQTCMHIACASGDEAVVRCLIKYGASTKKIDNSGNLPMHLAAQFVLHNVEFYKTHKDLLDPLIKHYPDGVYQKNHKVKTPADYLNEARENYHKFCTEAAAKNRSSLDYDSDESGKEDGYEVEKNQPSSREFEEKVAEEKEVECSVCR